jgi:hypothetical protein
MDFTAYSHSCLMALVPEHIAARVSAFSFAIPDDDIYLLDDEEHGRSDEIHCTVKYGLHTSNPDEVRGVLKGFDMIPAVLGGVTVFNNADYIVLKIDIESSKLEEMYKVVCSKLKHTDFYQGFKPHITIAYLNQREDDPHYYERYMCNVFRGVEILFDTMIFSTSYGDRTYIDLCGWGSDSLKVAKFNRVVEKICN